MTRLINVFLVCLSFVACEVLAQAGPQEPASEEQAQTLLYVIYDSSNSMWGELSDKSRKYEAGRAAIGPALEAVSSQRELAFRAYGHRRAKDCRDSELIVAPMAAKEAKPKIESAIQKIRPTGKTPISYSLKESLKDFGERKGDILLISDGIETCDIDPCALMQEWRDDGVKIRVHVVGVGLNDIERQSMACVAETGGGEYFDAGSAGEFKDALGKVSKIEPGEPAPIKREQGYGLNIKGADETGRSFVLEGKLFTKDGIEVANLSSNGHHWLEEPGEYSMTVGVRLKDGSIYEPITQPVSILEPGIKRVNLVVTRPAIVSATFAENGVEHRGSYVQAWQGGKEVFQFRRHDEALARPGTYEFRTQPNADNELQVEAALTAGLHTVVEFNLTKTVEVLLKYRLSNGETDQRGGELFREGKLAYTTSHSNYVTVKPGTYELRDKYPRAQLLNPLPPGTIVTISTEEKQIIDVPMSTGYITAEYAGAARDILSNSGYIHVHALDENGASIGSKILSSGTTLAAKPGSYRLLGRSGKGYYDPVEITVVQGQIASATLLAKPTAHVSMTYAPGAYAREPDRATLVQLEGQKPIKTYMGVGKVLKVLPGRYWIRPHSYTPEALPSPEFTLSAGETKVVVLQHR